jgi:hypothetical protein
LEMEISRVSVAEKMQSPHFTGRFPG